MKDKLYAEPVEVQNLEECYFYHTTDLPGYGTVYGSWDLRGNVDAYLGFADFSNKRVFDAGTGSGFLAFEAEKRGAREVVAFDLAQTEKWDYVPYSDKQLIEVCGSTLEEMIADKMSSLVKLNKSFWLSHRLFDSKVKMCYGSIYRIPKEIGPVDISVFGAILLHLRNPLNALEQAAAITSETIIIAEPYCPSLNNNVPMSVLIPAAENPSIFDAWWIHTPALLVQFLKILGFNEVKVNYHTQIRHELNRQPNPFYTIVATKR